MPLGFIDLQNLSTIVASFAVAFYSSWSMALVITAVLPLTIIAQYTQVGYAIIAWAQAGPNFLCNRVQTRMMTGQFSQDTKSVSKGNKV